MAEQPWTLERVASERPELAPLAQLHRELADTAARVEAGCADHALEPRYGGPPAVHWMHGRPLFDVVAHRTITAGVIATFGGLAATLARLIPDAAPAMAEIRTVVADDAFPWQERIETFRKAPPEGAVPHPDLFQFLLLRALARPTGYLARGASPPHPDRWLRDACPYCGMPPAAQIAGTGSSRALLCVLCGGRWRTADLSCVACGEDDTRKLLALASKDAGPASLEACETCHTSVKVFAESLLPYGAPVAAEVLTVALDLAAEEQEGFRRDPLALLAVFPPR